MLGGLGILVVAIIMIVMEVPYLKKNKLRKDSWAFSILLLIGVVLSIALSLNLYIPNPIDGVAVIYKPFSNFIYGLLK